MLYIPQHMFLILLVIIIIIIICKIIQYCNEPNKKQFIKLNDIYIETI